MKNVRKNWLLGMSAVVVVVVGCVIVYYVNLSKYDYVGFFSEGLAKVELNGKQGYVNRLGILTIPLKFKSVGDFSEGLANAAEVKRHYGYIDKTGKFVIQPQFYEAHQFSDGLAAVSFKESGKCGYIDKSGEIVIPIQFFYAYPFEKGMAKVNMAGNKYGFIDRRGQFVIPAIYDDIGIMGFNSKGVAKVEKGSKTLYIDRQGHEYPTEEDALKTVKNKK